VSDPRWLEGDQGRSTDELIELAATHRIDSIILAFDEALGRKAARVGPSGLSLPERTVLAANALEDAVNCDGFDGFFRNDAEYAPIILDSLATIGASDAAELTRRAITTLGLEGPLTPDSVEAAMDRDDPDRDDRLDAIDQAWYQSVRGVADLLLDFIRSHRAEIVLTGDLPRDDAARAPRV
jgi:hypothetical protein